MSINTNLLILFLSIILVYLFYPSYIGIIAPLFIAITLYYSTDNMIMSMFSILPPNVNDFILRNKTYIIVGLVAVSLYYAVQSRQEKEIDENILVLDMSDLSDFSLPDTSSSFIKSNSTFDLKEK